MMIEESLKTLASRSGHRPRTATIFVADILREAIATGAYSEGEQLRQNEISAALEVSRTPIREALRLLEAEGWVEFSPHRGAVVATLSVEDVKQIFEIRYVLEALALRQSLPLLKESDFNKASKILDEMDVETDIGQWVTLNRKFHLALYVEAGVRLKNLIETQYDAVDRYLRLELVEMENADESQEEHRAILAACRDRNVARAVELCEPHIAGAGVELAAALARRRKEV